MIRNGTAILLLFLCTHGFAQPNSNVMVLTEPRFYPAEKTILYRLGERTMPIKVSQYGEAKGYVCINLHDNETTSVAAARSILELRGGTLIKIENNRQRVVRFRLRGVTYAFDPNRIFSRTGIEQSLKENGRISEPAIGEVEKFAQRLLELLPETLDCIIALHNNTEEAYSVRSYLPGGDRAKDAKDVFAAAGQDVDDIIFTTDHRLFRAMADHDYNCIWQDNEQVKRDGSLSVYCGETKRKYVNIETQHGRTNQYMEMLEKLLDILEEEKPAQNDQ